MLLVWTASRKRQSLRKLLLLFIICLVVGTNVIATSLVGNYYFEECAFHGAPLRQCLKEKSNEWSVMFNMYVNLREKKNTFTELMVTVETIFSYAGYDPELFPWDLR